MRTFEDHEAVRAEVPLLIGIMAPSGGGKTFSALRLATGIQSVSGGSIFMIDTESRRGLAYSDKFKFRHIDFKAPFSPMDYLAAIEHCVKQRAKIIIIDSASHEHEGPGGVLEMHDAELQRLGGDMKKTFMAWQKPKSERRRLLNTLLQMPVHFIFCFRAKEKLKPVQGGQPKEMGFMPIAGEEFVFEMTANCLLLPNSGGVASWISDFVGEKMMMKLPDQFRSILSDKKPLDEEMGKRMALWARGENISAPVPASDLPAAWNEWTNEERGANRALQGVKVLQAWWSKTLTAEERETLKDFLPGWKETATKV